LSITEEKVVSFADSLLFCFHLSRFQILRATRHPSPLIVHAFHGFHVLLLLSNSASSHFLSFHLSLHRFSASNL